MDALLISPDQGNKERSFPWGVLAVGSYLTNVKKRHVHLLDANVLSEHEFRQELDRLLPDVRLVGIGCLSTDVYRVKELVDYIKETRPETKIILGGPHAVLEPEKTCRYKNIDFVAYTDGERTMDTLIEELDKASPDYEKVPGLIYKTDGKLKKTTLPQFAGCYDTDYHLLPERTRGTFGEYIAVLTGRGCPYRCRFCYNSIIRQTFRPRPIGEVIQEVEKVVKEHNPKLIYFRDDNFFQVKQRSIDFVRLYREKGFTFRWRASCRANYFNEKYMNAEFIRELASINCEGLKMGMECGTQRSLDYIHKDITIDEIRRAILEIANAKTINGYYSFMVGLPGQTVEEYIDTIKLIKFLLKHQPDAKLIGPQSLRIYPGGTLYEEIVEKYGYTQPASFEEWAQKTKSKNEWFAFYKNEKYPWIPPKGRNLVLYSHLLVLLYRKSLKSLFTLRQLPLLPFAILARLRLRYDWYSRLYDMWLLAKLYDLYKFFSPSAKPLGT